YFTFFLFTANATTEIYTLSLHDALPILVEAGREQSPIGACSVSPAPRYAVVPSAEEFHAECIRLLEADEASALYRRGLFGACSRSEEHTSELQSRRDLVCRLLLEKKKKK